MREDVKEVKTELEGIKQERTLASEIIHELKEDKRKLMIANICESVSLILAIIGLLLKR